MITTQIEYHDSIFIVLVGKNAQENWNIIEKSSQNDIWFHLGSELPSPHVVLQVPDNTKIPKMIILQCANICKLNSKYCNIKKVPIIYTQIKNIRKADKIGSVYTNKTTTIII